MVLQFVLIGEGPSDNALVSHLESICLELGADEVTGIELDFRRLPEDTKRNVATKLDAAMRLEPNSDLFLIHRDADSLDHLPRYTEIAAAIVECNCRKPWAAIVPVQETEAWLLLDEDAIRQVASKPHGRGHLGLPSPQGVEGKARPKELLQQAIITASETTGVRRKKMDVKFPENRRVLLQNLSIHGPIRQVPAWRRMYEDIGMALNVIKEVK